MKDSNELLLGNIIKLTRSSEKKFKLGNFKGAINDKMKANAILKSKSCDEKIIKKYREELSRLYSSKFDLIFDHKLKIDETANFCSHLAATPHQLESWGDFEFIN